MTVVDLENQEISTTMVTNIVAQVAMIVAAILGESAEMNGVVHAPMIEDENSDQQGVMT